MRHKFEIWQTDDINRMFVSSRRAKNSGLKIKKDKSYVKVYEGEIDTDGDDNVALETIYSKFQGVKPDGYSGRSVSVSDMISLDGHTYFTDSYGFKKLSKRAAMGLSEG